MKIALLTDLHANREALEAVLQHAASAGVERYAVLGDLVGYGADPAWVVDAIRRLAAAGAIVVQGNHDEAVVRGPRPTMRAEARDAVAWTRSRLSAEQLHFLAALQLTHTEADALFVHANAWRPAGWDYVDDRASAVRSLRATTARRTFCGHVHEPMLYHLSARGKAGDFRPQPDVVIPLPPHRQWLVIPGSVGQPRDNLPAACYAIYETAQPAVTYHRVPYDHLTAAAKVRAAGLPAILAQWLTDGG